ncbi:2-hydroxy-6-oxononadienedioate/2-hydroxy-6-oxononatrienedioate hydrolase [Starkeya nomas]|uniref:2-hydroxy-6-oxononadienedioate/2-hydroxy-6-oxonon atrienedioate hydrolase n=1 Tax=Starkeya nomas TaxID=2666134 RepID=A0A5S9NY71_9HYPH|nr:alpha/beta hydrolase [Starkeya nomas]CAA0095822.1 2-hydroxy-6-oxononadienedioate/2-hydroxy-6-oxononatrienedioate hydrolase [Starkeya nomas]
MNPVRLCLSAALLCFGTAALADTQQTYGPELQGFDYPHPVKRFDFTSQGKPVSMAYMDVAPAGTANGRTVVLLHGKNFCGATWQGTIDVLTKAGFRVVVPDQIGFCASTKPEGYQFSFHQLADNTRKLLASLGIEKTTVMGHSMGGMLAARYALSFPAATEKLVMANPLGLEDWKAKGVPYATIDQLYQGELKTSFDSIKGYQLKFYYNGQWKPEYDRWVAMQAGLYGGPGKEIVAWNQAQTSDMVFTQPVVYEFGDIAVPTLLVVGMTDKTAPGANRAAPEVARTLGNYAELGKATAKAIPGARLIEFPGLGHSPQVEAPETFHKALLEAL